MAIRGSWLAGSESILTVHVIEAFQYRSKGMMEL
jgi:hypothetical protein